MQLLLVVSRDFLCIVNCSESKLQMSSNVLLDQCIVTVPCVALLFSLVLIVDTRPLILDNVRRVFEVVICLWVTCVLGFFEMCF